MNGIITNTINDIFHIIWIYCLTLEPRFSRKKTLAITTGVIGAGQLLVWLMMYYSGSFSGYLIRMERIVFFLVFYIGALMLLVFLYLSLSAWKPVKSTFVIAAYICLWIFMYTVVSVTLRTFGQGGSLQIWTMRIALNLIFLYIFEVYMKKRLLDVDTHLYGGYYIATLLSVMCLIMLSILLVYSQIQRRYNLFLLFVLVFAFVFVVAIFTILFRYIEKLNNEKKLGQIMLHEELLTNQIKFYEEMEQNVRRTRHDIRHHNMIVEEFAKKGDCRGILSYLREYEEVEVEKYTRKFCNNSTLDSLLAVYDKRARQVGTDFIVDIKMADKLYITDFDMVSILANLLENAIHGSSLVKNERYISVSIKQKGYKLIIICKNSCVDNIKFVDGIPQSETREGIGTLSILQSVEKYNGNVNFKSADGIFTSRILLNNKSTEKGGQKHA